MAADEGKSRSFPMLPAANWWTLRSRFQRALPGRVDAQYIETVLGIQEKSARNIPPVLKALGLIDDDSKTTPLANEWRTDEGYPAACKEMLDTIYPAALRDAVPPENPSTDEAARWFMRERKVGEGAAGKMAALYALIAEADPKGAEAARPPRGERAAAERKPRVAAAGGRQTKATGSQQRQPPLPPPPPREESRSVAPSLHIDVQVHIPSDATPEQIDSIFASMAKHLYKQQS